MFLQLERDYSPLVRGQGARQRWMDGVFYYATDAQLHATIYVQHNPILNHFNNYHNCVTQMIPYT